MPDVLSLVAGILQLIDTVVKARDYIKDFHDAPKEQQEFLSELQALRVLLDELRKRFKPNGSVGVVKGIQQFEEPLGPEGNDGTRCEETGHDRCFEGLWSVGLAPMGQERGPGGMLLKNKGRIIAVTVLLIFRLGLRTNLSIPDVLAWINNSAESHHDVISSVKDQQQASHKILESVRDAAQNQELHENVLAVKERDKIIEWLAPINFFRRHEDIFAARQAGTGEWFLQSAEFGAWTANLGEILWCPGMPGAGKTVLASIFVDHLRENVEPDANIGVAVIYLNHKENETQTPSKFLAGLWRQLVFRKPMPLEVCKLYEKHREPQTRPSLEIFHQTLCSIIAEYSKVYIVVDALDEYPGERRNILLDKLSKLGPTVNLMLTSRPHISVTDAFQSRPWILWVRAATEDIQRYVDEEIARSSRLSKHIRSRPDLRKEIETLIVDRSDGMFLLAKLHISSLTMKHTVRDALRTLPRDLQSTYDEVMERINRQNEDDRNLALSALCWISNTKSLLSVSDLTRALCIEPGIANFDPENMVWSLLTALRCEDLVASPTQLSDSHFTTQDYLEQKQAIYFPRANTEITLACIAYLSLTFKLKTWWEDPRLDMEPNAPCVWVWHYAVIHVLTHVYASFVETVKVDKTILRFIAECYAWPVWRSCMYSPMSKARIGLSSLDISIFFHSVLDDISKHLQKEDVNILNVAVLQEASVQGDLEMVRSLVKYGADVNWRIRDDYALHLASAAGKEDMVCLLIDSGARINGRGRDFGTTLQVASANGHEVAAASHGHKSAVCLLLVNGADVNVPGGSEFCGAAIRGASANNYKDVVRLLIENGANIDMHEHLGLALELASSKGQTNIVRGLMEKCAAVNLPAVLEMHHKTALQAAAASGQAEVVHLLIENGANANIEPEGGLYGNALQVASAKRHTNVIRILIAKGVDVNMQEDAAAVNGRKEVVDLLTENGADANIEGGLYDVNAKYGININLDPMRGAGLRTALGAAAINGHQEIVAFLEANGAPGGSFE
ncbi:ankyrin repeat-containing domain protein [Mycena epipterygia]|nr:ankyrin repeat-containing domain protein [Mycena epipterygia]